MSLWRLTKYEQVLNREWTLIALLPDYEKGEKTPFEACILVSEDGCEAVELQISDHTLARVWFREGVPCRAELQSDGRVTVACEIENWS